MILQKEIEDLFARALQGIPWVIRKGTGEIAPFDEPTAEELIHGLTIQVQAHERAILMLARAIDNAGHS